MFSKKFLPNKPQSNTPFLVYFMLFFRAAHVQQTIILALHIKSANQHPTHV